MADEVVIYHYYSSYWSQMVRLAAVEKGIAFRKVDIDIKKGENYSPEYLRINPACEVPAITHRGKTISGSQDIIDYFDTITTTKEKPGNADQAEIEEFRKKCVALPIAEITIGVAVHPNLWDGAQIPEQIRESFSKRINRVVILEANIVKYPELACAYRDKLERVIQSEGRAKNLQTVYALLTDLEAYLDGVNSVLRKQAEKTGSDDHWLFGKDFTNADIALATLLARMDLLGFAGRLWDQSERCYLAEYYRRLKLRASFKQECVPDLHVTLGIDK